MSHHKKYLLEKVLAPLEDEIEFFFSNFIGASYPSIYRKELCWKPPTDVYETETDYVIILELAQVKNEEVSITFRDGILTIRGVRQTIPPSERRHYLKMEISYGPFERKIAISGDVDMDQLSAQYKDGFLEIRLPKKKTNSFNIEIE
ncbi:Hsp20/alpha crystallin family protein [bacterium]|nr:Hsp20/alpha crystallin family protein [bacterium]RQV97497.1 MAG: Hsp20/alpha crystallin family protein [bacterium]